MLSFFPTLYPDELLYSALARYHIRSGNRIFRQSDLELFGYSSRQVCKITLTNNLIYLVQNLPLRSQQTVDSLLQNHTLYPFYATFLMPQEAWLLKDSMRKKLSGSILEIAKVAMNSSGDSKKFLKFCPVCLIEDTQKYGEPYWHRMHQIPGVLVCPTHGFVLLDSYIAVESKGIHYHAANPDNCLVNKDVTSFTSKTLETLLTLTNDIKLLINSNISFKGLAWLRGQYQRYLVNKGLMQIFPGGKFKFNEQEFFRCMLSFYGQECLEAINPRLIQHQGKYFSHCLLACDVNPAIDRITHVLIIKFLIDSIQAFFQH